MVAITRTHRNKSREDPSFLPMRTCAKGNNYEVLKVVPSITLEEYTLEQLCHFCMSQQD